jgi:hypothetical protein
MMAIQTLPIRTPGGTGDRELLGMRATSRPAFTLREALDGTTIAMRFAWQQAADMWVQDLSTSSGLVIRRGVGLVAAGVDLWANFQYRAGMPGGQLWVSWGDQRPRKPGRDDWQGDARLYYRPAALVAAVRGSELELL